MAARKVARCKACWNGDCHDCTQWTDRQSTCQHRCDVQPHQLLLPWETARSPEVAPTPRRSRSSTLPAPRKAR